MGLNRKAIRVILIVGGALLLPVCCVWSFQNRVGTAGRPSEAAVSGLPSQATNIEWFLPGAFGPNRVYAFDTSLAGFQQWVAQRSRPKLTGPHTGPYEILVYDHAKGKFASHQISNAVAYTWSEEDRGVHMVYDQDTGRAYFHSHTR